MRIGKMERRKDARLPRTLSGTRPLNDPASFVGGGPTPPDSAERAHCAAAQTWRRESEAVSIAQPGKTRDEKKAPMRRKISPSEQRSSADANEPKAENVFGVSCHRLRVFRIRRRPRRSFPADFAPGM